MNKNKLSIGTVALMGGVSISAHALDLYVDPATQQVFTTPGKGRVKLNDSEKGSAASSDAKETDFREFERKLDQKKAELQAMEARLDKKKTELEIMEARLDKKTQAMNIVAEKAEKTGTVDTPPDAHAEMMAAAADKPEKAEPSKAKSSDALPVEASYGKKGFELKTKDGKYAMAIQNRLQVRYAEPFDKDPRSISDLEQDTSSFMVRRARTKVSGHAYWPWLKYYMQYDWSQPVLRDFYLNIDKYQWAQLRVGRGKVLWNDERVTSSGNQQFVNRSIVNDIFTVDRQQGVQVFGRLFPETWHDISYYTGVFTGLGVGERTNDDDDMMWTGRLQWNALGGEMPFSQSDIEYHENPALNFAFAAATNKSKCTAFETASDSCRALPGFTVGEPGQYQVDQMMEEIRFKWRGFSVQHEMHWKTVVDTLWETGKQSNAQKTNLWGGYVQAGYFPHYLLPLVPKNLEFAGRFAWVDPNVDIGNDLQQEASAVMTYFFNGHSNKLNFQVSHLTVDDPSSGESDSAERYWVQWDISF